MAVITSLSKVSISKAAVICQDITIDSEAKILLDSDPDPVMFINALMAQKLYFDGIRFMARALPKREATWWACLSARSSLTPETAQERLKALVAAEAWVFKPTEEHRREANALANLAGMDNAQAWAAMAAFWSDGSMTPENTPPVIPADNLVSKAVAGAVMLAAVQTHPEKADEKYLFFLEQAIEIANGGNGKLWQA